MVIDAAAIEKDVEVIELKPRELGDSVLSMISSGSHGIGIEDIVTFLSTGRLKTRFILVGCKPHKIDVGIGLSTEMKQNCIKAIEELGKLLEIFNVKLNVEESKENFLKNEI
ncbi:hypothetical protein HLB03_03280 [Acidianus sp. DSM 29099]|nr:hypothetical protein [Acidianus sp. RZ1]